MKITRRRFLCAACAAYATAVAATACATNASSDPQPPNIAYGRDVCEQCGMIISEPRFATATVLEDGTSHKFDDIGDMVLYHFDHPDQKVKAYFAHDYNSQEWIRAETATFVASDQIKSPMGHGLAAFLKSSDAESFASEVNGKVMNFEGLRAFVHVNPHR
jgi:copper chaperone NosL